MINKDKIFRKLHRDLFPEYLTELLWTKRCEFMSSKDYVYGEQMKLDLCLEDYYSLFEYQRKENYVHVNPHWIIFDIQLSYPTTINNSSSPQLEDAEIYQTNNLQTFTMTTSFASDESVILNSPELFKSWISGIKFQPLEK